MSASSSPPSGSSRASPAHPRDTHSARALEAPHKLRLGKHMALHGPPHVGHPPSRSEAGPRVERRQREHVAMGRPAGWTRAAVADATEVVQALRASPPPPTRVSGRPPAAHAPPAAGRRRSSGRTSPPGASGSLTIRTKLFTLSGTSDHRSAGESTFTRVAWRNSSVRLEDRGEIHRCAPQRSGIVFELHGRCHTGFVRLHGLARRRRPYHCPSCAAPGHACPTLGPPVLPSPMMWHASCRAAAGRAGRW